ncbi:MAG TPA: hypothetical protein PKA27_09870 [Fimbriimonadaceae bacterium]|nr:hypothetical protein [Fimbriimonadaceae bacterium]
MIQRLRLMCIGCIGVLVMFGCGGSGAITGSKVTGALSMEVVWPDPSRLVPVSANRINVTVKKGVASVNVPTSVNFPDKRVDIGPLEAGTYTVVAEAYKRQNNSDGEALARGEATIVIVGGEKTRFTVVMESTLQAFEVKFPNYNPVGNRGPYAVESGNDPDDKGNLYGKIRVRGATPLRFECRALSSFPGGNVLNLDNNPNVFPGEFNVFAERDVLVKNVLVKTDSNGQYLEGELLRPAGLNGNDNDGILAITYRETGDTFRFRVRVSEN